MTGARLQQPRDHVDDLLAALAHGVGEGLRTGGLGIKHDPRRAVGVDVLQHRQDGAAQQIVRALLEVDVLADRLDEAAQFPAQAGAEEFFLGAVVQIEHRLGDLRLGGDDVHRGLVVAVDREHLHGGVEHLLLAHGTRQPLGATCHVVASRCG